MRPVGPEFCVQYYSQEKYLPTASLPRWLSSLISPVEISILYDKIWEPVYVQGSEQGKVCGFCPVPGVGDSSVKGLENVREDPVTSRLWVGGLLGCGEWSSMWPVIHIAVMRMAFSLS